jgi:hypothetical protein
MSLRQLRRRKEGSHAEDGVYAALTLALDATFDTGETRATPVDDSDYQVPFKFTGKIDKLTIKVTPPVLTPEDEKVSMSRTECVGRLINPLVNGILQEARVSRWAG